MDREAEDHIFYIGSDVREFYSVDPSCASSLAEVIRSGPQSNQSSQGVLGGGVLFHSVGRRQSPSIFP